MAHVVTLGYGRGIFSTFPSWEAAFMVLALTTVIAGSLTLLVFLCEAASVLKDRYWFKIDQGRLIELESDISTAWYIGDDRLYVQDIVDVSEVPLDEYDVDIEYGCLREFSELFGNGKSFVSSVEYGRIGEVQCLRNAIKLKTPHGRLMCKVFVGDNKADDVVRFADLIMERIRLHCGGGIHDDSL